MPWTPEEATKHTKSAKSRKQKRQWAHVANSMLKRTGNEGKAIRAANAAVGSDCARDAAGIELWLDSVFKAETSSETCPQCKGSGEDVPGQKCTNCQGSGSVNVPLDVPRNADADPDEEDPEEARERRAELGEEEELEELEEDAEDREFSTEQRKKAAESGAAMKGGGYPIKNKKDLKNAMQALGRAKNRSATIAHIKKRARALGVELPENWPNDAAPKDEAITMQVLGDVQLELEMCDDIELDDDAKVRFIDGGYLSAYPRIARTGIQIYKGKECGKPDVDLVSVYRPEDEVFAKDAVHSYTHLPVTNSHPGIMVDAKNWNKYAKGDTGDEVLRDGNSVRVPMMLRDHDTIKDFKDGKNQLSVGYTCDLDWTPGTTADGEKFDAIQRNIKANHLALVAAARGGPTLRIGDAAADNRGDSTMSGILKNVVIDGVQVEMSDTAAQVVQRALMQAQTQVDEFKKKAAKAEEEEEEKEEEDAKKDAAIRAKDAKIATLEQQLKDAQWTPAKLDIEVKQRQFVIDKARAILGKSLIIDNRTVEDIRKQVVEHRMGARANGWDDGQILSSFDTITDEVRPGGTIRDAANAFSRPHFVRDVDPKQAAYDEYDRDMANAWKGPNQQRA